MAPHVWKDQCCIKRIIYNNLLIFLLNSCSIEVFNLVNILWHFLLLFMCYLKKGTLLCIKGYKVFILLATSNLNREIIVMMTAAEPCFSTPFTTLVVMVMVTGYISLPFARQPPTPFREGHPVPQLRGHHCPGMQQQHLPQVYQVHCLGRSSQGNDVLEVQVLDDLHENFPMDLIELL